MSVSDVCYSGIHTCYTLALSALYIHNHANPEIKMYSDYRWALAFKRLVG